MFVCFFGKLEPAKHPAGFAQPMPAAKREGLRGGVDGGVLSLSFSRHYNFLTSVGQDREPHLWPINMPATRPFLLRDPEHAAASFPT